NDAQQDVEADFKNGEESKIVKPKARWHSFEKKTLPKQFHGYNVFYSIYSTPCISELTAPEMTQIKSVITLRLNNMMSNNEKIESGGSKRASNIFRRLFRYESKNKILKYSLEWNTQRFGCPFPPFIVSILEKIGREGCLESGIFRKCGKKSNISELEKIMFSEHTNIDLSKYSLYDLADLLKIFLLTLPPFLPPFKLGLRPEKHLLICQSTLLLMPDENREALHLLIDCLKKIANNCEKNLIPYEIHTLSRITTLHSATPMRLDLLGSNENEGVKGNYESYMNINIDEFYLEHCNKYKAWGNFCTVNGVQICSRKVKDGYPLSLYRGYIDLDVRASEIFICYLYKGQWNTCDGTHILACTSIKICEKDLVNCNLPVQNHRKIIGDNSHPRGIILGARFVVEPMQLKSRVNLILRIDLKGRQASSYTNITPYIISQELNSLKKYFSTPPSQLNTLEEAIV
ncbi:hypothetical protein MXB_2375, partial [Myxobolus squamalis]